MGHQRHESSRVGHPVQIAGVAADRGDKCHVHNVFVDIFGRGSGRDGVRPQRRGMHDRLNVRVV